MKSNFVGTGLSAHNLVDMAGLRFGRLVVVKKNQSLKNRARWVCTCDCGRTCIATGKTLREGRKKSCGCWFGEKFLPTSKTDLPAMRFLMKRYQLSATPRGHSFSLSEEQFRTLTSSPCHYCGELPKQLISNYAIPYVYNGIDRVDNHAGYVFENCVPCCKFCNQSKSNRTVQEFLDGCLRVTKFQNSKTLAEMPSVGI